MGRLQSCPDVLTGGYEGGSCVSSGPLKAFWVRLFYTRGEDGPEVSGSDGSGGGNRLPNV